MNTHLLQINKLRNLVQSLLLLLGLGLILSLIGWIIGGMLLVIISIGLLLFAYYMNSSVSPAWLLRMYHARPIPYAHAPSLYDALKILCQRAELGYVPTLYHIPSPVMNAFTIGNEENSVIALSSGLLKRLSFRECVGVLAHEVSHCLHQDIRVMSFADLASRMTTLLSHFGYLLLLINLPLLLAGYVVFHWELILTLILAPLATTLLQLALSRTREYDADLRAAILLGDPRPLAEALHKTEHYQGRLLEQIYMPGKRIAEPSIIRTHPPSEERIKRLLALLEQDSEVFTYERLPLDHSSSLQRQPAVTYRHPRRRLSGLWF